MSVEKRRWKQQHRRYQKRLHQKQIQQSHRPTHVQLFGPKVIQEPEKECLIQIRQNRRNVMVFELLMVTSMNPQKTPANIIITRNITTWGGKSFCKKVVGIFFWLSFLLRQGTVTSEFFTICRRFAKIFSPGCLKSSLRRKSCHHQRDVINHVVIMKPVGDE